MLRLKSSFGWVGQNIFILYIHFGEYLHIGKTWPLCTSPRTKFIWKEDTYFRNSSAHVLIWLSGDRKKCSSERRRTCSEPSQGGRPHRGGRQAQEAAGLRPGEQHDQTFWHELVCCTQSKFKPVSWRCLGYLFLNINTLRLGFRYEIRPGSPEKEVMYSLTMQIEHPKDSNDSKNSKK